MIIISGILCIVTALIFKISPPKINSIFGYKSILSMKNQDTWYEALRYSSNTFIILGFIFIPLEFILSEFNVSYEYATVIVVVCFAIMIIINESHLRKVFNSDGIRK